MYWIGNGVINIKGKDYEKGDKIPWNNLSKDRQEYLKKNNLVGEKIIEPAGKSKNAEEKLQKQITELKFTLTDCKTEMAEYVSQIESLEKENVILQEKIESLEKEKK